MAPDVARYLASAGRMADMHGIPQVEVGDELGEVVRIGVEVVAVPRLARAAVPAPVMRDAAIAAVGQIEHLVLEGVRREGPAVAEDDGLPLAPVVVVERGAIGSVERRHVCTHS